MIRPGGRALGRQIEPCVSRRAVSAGLTEGRQPDLQRDRPPATRQPTRFRAAAPGEPRRARAGARSPSQSCRPSDRARGTVSSGLPSASCSDFARREIGDQKRPALVRTEGDDGETALVPQTAQRSGLALEAGQLTPALHVVRVPELEPGRPPVFERLDPKGGAVLRRAKDLQQPPASRDDLMEKGRPAPDALQPFNRLTRSAA